MYYASIIILKALQKYYDENKNISHVINRHTKVNYKVM